MKQLFHRRFEEILVGDTATMQVIITQEMISDYAVFIGDSNSFHLSQALNAETEYPKQTCQGSLMLGYFSLLAAQQLPGFGAILCHMDADFIAPVYLGDTIVFSIKVTQKLTRRRLQLGATAYNQNGQLCINGNLVIKTMN